MRIILNLETPMSQEKIRGPKTVPLFQAPAGSPLKIVSVDGGHGVRQRLFALGLHVGDVVEIQSQWIFRGPILVRNLASDTSLALGRGIAQKIVVELLDER